LYTQSRQLTFKYTSCRLLTVCKERAEFINLYELTIQTDLSEEPERVTNYLPLIEDLNVRELTVQCDYDRYEYDVDYSVCSVH
jgi:hypothetical protein